MAARFTAPLLSLMSSGQSYNGSDSRISLALGIICYPHTCIPQPPFRFPSEIVPVLPWDAHPHVSATALPQPCSQVWHPPGAPCSAHPPVYAQTTHNSQDIHLPLVLQLLAPDPGGNEGAGAANACAAGQTDTAVGAVTASTATPASC